MQLRQQTLDAIVERFRRKAFVAPAVKADRRRIANAEHCVLRVAQEQIVVIRVRTVPGIRKPEILPYDDAVPVAGFIKSGVPDLPHPVADHIEVHFAVVAQGSVIFARAVAQHRFAESPVASPRY